MRSSAVTAAARLRAEVLALDGMVLIINPGKPDKVIRVSPVPEYLAAIREEQREDKRPKKFVRDPVSGREYFERIPVDPATEQKHVELNLMRMPHQEAFKMLEREIHLKSPRDRTLPEPLSVCEGPREEWAAIPEDVPFVDLSDAPSGIDPQAHRPLAVPLEEIASFQCSECDATFPKKQGLLMHIRHRHPQKAVMDERDAKKAEASKSEAR